MTPLHSHMTQQDKSTVTSMDLSTDLTPEAAAVTALIILATYFLISHRDRLQRAIAAHSGRRRLRRLVAQHESSTAASADCPTVSSLHVHPVKSLRPISVNSSSVGPLGLNGDRCLMIVKPNPTTVYSDPSKPTHRFVTQRQVASLATIKASLPTVVDSDNGDKIIIRLSIDFCGSEKAVHVDVTPSSLSNYPIRYRAGLWDDVVTVVDVGDEAAKFVGDVIAQDEDKYAREAYQNVRVVSLLHGATHRPLDQRYLPPAAFSWTGGIPRTSLNDGFPVLVACEASLEELNKRLVKRGKKPIPMNRFRPNIVIKGTKPFEEDTWKSILFRSSSGSSSTGSHGGSEKLVLHIVKGCPRCKQSCTDQQTGERSEEPLETLTTFRALGTSKEDVYFAQNAVPHGKGGTVKVGDEVVVLEQGEPVWDKDTVQAE